MKVLAVIRCGDKSLHPNWVNQNSNFDVVLSYFGDSIKYNLSHIKHVHYFKGSKWEGLYNFFEKNTSLWKKYDYIWLPDDDLDTNTTTLNQYFLLNHKYKFSLSQPALTTNSYYSHPMLLQVSNFIYRNTNFVEVMAPCFSKDAFEKCWETFAENKSGWGLDSLWPKILQGENIGVIDQYPIHHTRPVGIAGNGTGDSSVSPLAEAKLVFKKYNITLLNGCFSGLKVNEVFINSKEKLLEEIVIGSPSIRLKSIYDFNKLYDEIMNPTKKLYTSRPRWKKILGVK